MDNNFYILSFIFLLGLFSNVYSNEAEEAEGKRNAVIIEFYQLTDTSWPDKSDDFKEAVADAANDYCSNNRTACSLTDWKSDFAFAADSVIYADDYPKKNVTNYSLYIKFYVKFNTLAAAASTSTDYVLRKSSLKASVAASRSDINSAVGNDIIGVDKTVFTPEPKIILNVAISLAAVFFLLILIILTVVLYKYQQKMEKERSRTRKQKVVMDTETPPEPQKPKKKKSADKKKKKRRSKKEEPANHDVVVYSVPPSGGANYDGRELKAKSMDNSFNYDSGVNESEGHYYGNGHSAKYTSEF